MSDDTKEPAAAPPVPEIVAPRFPQGHLFSEDVLKSWVAIPEDEPVFIGPLTRGDLDNFLFGFGDMTVAIAELRQGLIEYSNGRVEHADAHLQNALNRNIDAETRNRILFDAIIKSVIGARENAGK